MLHQLWIGFPLDTLRRSLLAQEDKVIEFRRIIAVALRGHAGGNFGRDRQAQCRAALRIVSYTDDHFCSSFRL
jgi:hypothetical protein